MQGAAVCMAYMDVPAARAEAPRLLDALGVARASVVGHSMGGMLAARFATQYPDRTEKLVLVNPIGLDDYRRLVPYLGVDGWRGQAAKQTPGGRWARRSPPLKTPPPSPL